MKLLAKLTSHAFGPFSVLPIILVTVPLLKVDLTREQLVVMAPVLVLTLIVYPVSLFIYFLKTGRISDVDATIRQEREGLYTWAMLGPWLAAVASWQWGNTALTELLLLLTATVTLLTVFTHREKVSAHMAINTAAYLIVNILYNWRLWWLFPLLIAIAWSRWYLKRHSLHQLILGTLIPVVVFLTGVYQLG